ncbi:MAG: NAD(P)H-binding protein [Alphaproteobacteria bacterium]
MKIIVFGARGDVGSRVVAEALSRNHTVTAVVRDARQVSSLPEGASAVVIDVRHTNDLARAMAGHDLAVSAIRPPQGHEPDLVPLTESVLDAAAATRVRVLVVGGAARLFVPGTDRHTVLTAPGFLPVAVVPVARASQAQYELCLSHEGADWVYASPAAMLTPGNRTGSYRSGKDELLVNEDGDSTVSMEDFAVALVDEGEANRLHRDRFTVAY